MAAPAAAIKRGGAHDMTASINAAQKLKPTEQRAHALRMKNNRLGMTIFQASWIMVFLAMIVVNWQLRYSYAKWPPEGVAPFDALLPSFATALLLFSSFFAQKGLAAFRGGRMDLFAFAWRLTLALAVAFMLLIAREFMAVSAEALATQYGVTLRLMTGFHFVHALAIVGALLFVYRRAVNGRYAGESDAWAVEGTVKLWHFVAVAWILFYVALYWVR